MQHDLQRLESHLQAGDRQQIYNGVMDNGATPGNEALGRFAMNQQGRLRTSLSSVLQRPTPNIPKTPAPPEEQADARTASTHPVTNTGDQHKEFSPVQGGGATRQAMDPSPSDLVYYFRLQVFTNCSIVLPMYPIMPKIKLSE